VIFQTQTLSFKAELPQAVHNLLTDTIKLALYTSAADLSEATTVYSATNEVSGTGYSAGGIVLTGVTISTADNVVYIDFNDAVWNPAAFTSAGGLIQVYSGPEFWRGQDCYEHLHGADADQLFQFCAASIYLRS